MYESGSVWYLIAADGTAITLNDGISGVFLEEITGFDSPNVRQNITELPEQDGAAAGNFYFGARPVTLKGKISATPATRNLLMMSMQRAARGMTQDTSLLNTSTGLPAMQAYGRIDNLRFSGGYVKDFQLSMICADPRIYSQAVHTASGSGQIASSGAAFPLVFPINFGGGTGAALIITVTNAGNYDAPAVFTVSGPISDPLIRNVTTGATWYLDGVSLTVGESVTVDMLAHTVVKSDSANLYSKVRFPTSTWFFLTPGANQIELRSSTSSSSSAMSVTFRDVWV